MARSITQSVCFISLGNIDLSRTLEYKYTNAIYEFDGRVASSRFAEADHPVDHIPFYEHIVQATPFPEASNLFVQVPRSGDTVCAIVLSRASATLNGRPAV